MPIVAAALFAMNILAVQQPGRTAQPQPQPFSGPAVTERAGRASLVSFDMNGRLRRLDTSPEAAALRLVHTSPDTRARAEAVIADRAAAIDCFVTENLTLLSQLDTASKAGSGLDKAVLFMRAFDQIRPALRPGPMRDRIIAALPAREAGEFRGYFDEYWSAVVSESLRDNRAQGKKDQRWQVDLGERFNHLGQEIARSFERQSTSGTLFVDALLTGLDLTTAQQEIINTLKLDMLERSNFRPSEEDQKRLGLGILAYLNAEQRTAVIKRVAGR